MIGKMRLLQILFIGLTLLVSSSVGQIRCKILGKNPDEKAIALLSSSNTTSDHGKTCISNESCSNNFNITFMDIKSYLDTSEVIMNISFQAMVADRLSFPCGFKIQIDKVLSQYFCLATRHNLIYEDFMFECNKTVIPSQHYMIGLSALHEKKNIVTRDYEVPGCENEKFKKAAVCLNFSLNVPKKCNNRTMEFEYMINTTYFNTRATATIRLCKKGVLVCQDIPGSNLITKLPLKGSVNLTFPESAPLDKHYFVEMLCVVSGMVIDRKKENVTDLLRSCFLETKTDFPYLLISVILAVFVVILIGICIYKRICCLKLVSKYLKEEHEMSSSEPECLYLNFVNDDSKHEDVVLKFAAFLELDLGFRVKFELYEREKFRNDPVMWVKNALDMSSKVVFVWSPEATKQWKIKNEINALESMFTLILDKAIEDMVSPSVRNKYFIIHFDYWDNGLIPKQFKEKPFKYFNLMKDIRKFYSSLKKPNTSRTKTNCLSDDLNIASFDFSSSQYFEILSKSIKDIKTSLTSNESRAVRQFSNSDLQYEIKSQIKCAMNNFNYDTNSNKREVTSPKDENDINCSANYKNDKNCDIPSTSKKPEIVNFVPINELHENGCSDVKNYMTVHRSCNSLVFNQFIQPPISNNDQLTCSNVQRSICSNCQPSTSSNGQSPICINAKRPICVNNSSQNCSNAQVPIHCNTLFKSDLAQINNPQFQDNGSNLKKKLVKYHPGRNQTLHFAQHCSDITDGNETFQKASQNSKVSPTECDERNAEYNSSFKIAYEKRPTIALAPIETKIDPFECLLDINRKTLQRIA